MTILTGDEMLSVFNIYFIYSLAGANMAGIFSKRSQDEINFLKIDTLIKKVATPTVKKLFDVFVSPNDLANVLNNNANLIQNLYKKKIIKEYQLDILLRVPGVQFLFVSSTPHKKGQLKNMTKASFCNFNRIIDHCLHCKRMIIVYIQSAIKSTVKCFFVNFEMLLSVYIFFDVHYYVYRY